MEPVRSFCKDSLAVRIYADRTAMGAAAARDGAALLRRLLAQQDTVRAVFAAAPSQNEFLEALCAAPDIDWKRVTAFHMDEYVGLDAAAPQGFGNFLRARVFDRLPFGQVCYLNGNAPDVEAECSRYAGLLDTIWAVILPGAVSTWNFIVMRSFFDNYPSEIEESGKVDGLTDAGVFFRLVLPTSKAVLATIGLYYAVSLWNAYFIPFIYLNDPDLFSLQLILHELLSAGSSNNATVGVGDVLVVEESLKYATVLVSIAPIMCVYPFLQKYFVKGVMIGAVKG